MTHRIVFFDRATIAPQIRVRRPAFAHDWAEYDRTGPGEVVERARDADIIILNKVQLTAQMIGHLPKLRLVAVAATGTDCVDKVAAAQAGIRVVNIRGYATATVPEHSFALILGLMRSIVPYRADVLAGEWQKAAQFCFFNHPIKDLAGRRLAIFGSGNLGGRMAEIARVFGMDAVFAGRKGAAEMREGYISFDEVLETADIITLHCPLTEETRNLIAMPEFRRMKRKPLIINTARGALVNELDLETALEEGLVSGAGFDVTLPEPPPADSPLMRIARRPNVIVTPHTAWASDEAQQTLADQLIDNIEYFVAGNPVNIVV